MDLSSLDPRSDGAHFESLVRNIRAAAEPELRRRRSLGLWTQIALWRVPVAVGAALLAVASLLVLATVPRVASTSTANEMTEAMGVPSGLAPYVNTGGKPTVGVLLENDWSSL